MHKKSYKVIKADEENRVKILSALGELGATTVKELIYTNKFGSPLTVKSNILILVSEGLVEISGEEVSIVPGKKFTSVDVAEPVKIVNWVRNHPVGSYVNHTFSHERHQYEMEVIGYSMTAKSWMDPQIVLRFKKEEIIGITPYQRGYGERVSIYEIMEENP